MLHEYPLLFLVRIKCKKEIFFYFGMWYNKIKIWKSKEKTIRLLFNMDANDYDKNGRAFVRHSARCITIQNGRVAMVHSLKYDYYKFQAAALSRTKQRFRHSSAKPRKKRGLLLFRNRFGSLVMSIGLKRVTTWMQIILCRIIFIICVKCRKPRRARNLTIMKRTSILPLSGWNRTKLS